jgi:hypothetical protein
MTASPSSPAYGRTTSFRTAPCAAAGAFAARRSAMFARIKTIASSGFKARLWTIGLLCSIALCARAEAYTVVTSTAPATLEQALIAQIQNQFVATVFVNPLVPNTWQIKLLGVNPNYNPLVTNQQMLDATVLMSTTNFVYGFADGMTYQQKVQEGSVGFLGNLCATATYFNLIQTSSKTFDRSTCQDVITTIEDALFELSLSTPTPIPPEP